MLIGINIYYEINIIEVIVKITKFHHILNNYCHCKEKKKVDRYLHEITLQKNMISQKKIYVRTI